MAADYATIDDLKKHWATLPQDREEESKQKLHEASIEIRALYPDLDARIASGKLDADIPKLVVCRMVKRAMDIKDDDLPVAGLESVQFGAGPFSMGGKIRNPDGNLYLTAADKRLLGPVKSKGKAWTIHPGGLT